MDLLNTRRRGVRAACLASAAFMSTHCFAAEAGKSSLEEVVVTARKTTENVQNVPVTVNVLSAGLLESLGVANVSNISSLAPNVLWDDSGGGQLTNKITIRGIQSNASKGGFDPGVGIYLDEVYIGDELGFNSTLLDVDRIEVLKGPQGTLFGRNSIAGAISIHTRAPSFSGNSVEGDVQAGNYALREGRFVANFAASSDVAIKLSGVYRKRDGYGFNTVTQKHDANDENHYGGRAQLLWKPIDRLSVLATADWSKDKGSNEIAACYGVGASANPCGGIHPTRDSVTDGVVQDNNSRSHRTMWSASVNADYALANGFSLTSISAYRHLTAHNDQDQDYTGLDYIRSGFNVPKDWQVSEELRLTTPRDKALKGVAGVFYFHEQRTAILPLIFEPLALTALRQPAAEGISITNSGQETESFAVFGQGTYDITKTLTAEAGLRYTRDHKNFDYEETLNSVFLAIPLATRNSAGIPLVIPKTTDSESWGRTTGTASISWTPITSVMAYGRYSTGYKSGGYNNSQTNTGFNPTKPFGPETLNQFEVGVKSELFDHMIRVNVSAFTMGYKDIQLQITNPVDFSKYIDNAGNVRSKGAEMEFTTATFKGVTLFGNLGLQHSHYTFIKTGGTLSLLGKAIPYAPKATASLGISDVTPVGRGLQLRSSLSAGYRSNMYVDTGNTVISREIALVNGRVGIEREDGRWGAFLWGNNIGNSRRITSSTGAKGGLMLGASRVSTPETYGVEIKGRF